MANELKQLIEKREDLAEQRLAQLDLHSKVLAGIDSDLLEVLNAIADHVESDTPKPAPKRRTKKAPPQPDHDKVARQYADFEPAADGCLCGCGEHVADDVNFVRGHQKRLQSIAKAVAADKLSGDKMSNAGHSYARSQGWMAGPD